MERDMMQGDMPCNAPAPTPDATGAHPAGAAAMCRAKTGERKAMNDGKTIADIAAEMRQEASDCPDIERAGIYDRYADRFEAAAKHEADSIERLVRDAIIDYQEMYPHAPNDEAERELVERAERGNAWLVAHGYEPEKTIWDKEESSCL